MNSDLACVARRIGTIVVMAAGMAVLIAGAVNPSISAIVLLAMAGVVLFLAIYEPTTNDHFDLAKDLDQSVRDRMGRAKRKTKAGGRNET